MAQFSQYGRLVFRHGLLQRGLAGADSLAIGFTEHG
jgi:hypothetical protein